jgi:hypothetical protein
MKTMTIDTSKMVVADSEIIETALPSYLLAAAFEIINHSGKRHIPAEWMEVINIASVAPLNGLVPRRVQKIATEMDRIARLCAASSGASNGSEYALGVSLAVLELVRIGQIINTKIQGVLISTRFVEEAIAFEDVADLKRAKSVSEKVRNTLNQQGYFNK